MDEWIRRRLGQLLRKRWKKGTTRYRELSRLGVSNERAALGATGRSPWRMAYAPVIQGALSNTYWRNSRQKASLNDTTAYVVLIEPPDAALHVRWCEREWLAAALYSIDARMNVRDLRIDECRKIRKMSLGVTVHGSGLLLMDP